MNKTTKMIISIILTVVLATAMDMPVLAEEPHLVISAREADDDYQHGRDISTSNENSVVEVVADNGHTATVGFKSIENTDAEGIGIDIFAINGGTADATIDVNIKADYGGIHQETTSGSNSAVHVTGDVTSDNGYALYAPVGNNSYMETVIDGTVTGYVGAEIRANDSTNAMANVVFKNDIIAVGDGIYTILQDGAINVSVGGDIIGARDGIVTKMTGGEVTILVEGTVDASHAGIVIDNQSTALPTVTVWKIEPNAEENVAVNSTGGANQEMESSIQYIIRVNQPQSGGTIRITDANGDELARVEGVNDHVWNVANENDRVLVKIDVQSGYQLSKVYGGENQTLPLAKDANGDYYVLVPKGGGVSISAVISQIPNPPAPQPLEEQRAVDFGNGSVIAPVPVPGMSDLQMIMAINSAAPGGTVVFTNLTGTGLSADVVQAMLMRRDITIVMTYITEGGPYKVVIPAGADLTALLNASGGIDFVNLGVTFGATPI